MPIVITHTGLGHQGVDQFAEVGLEEAVIDFDTTTPVEADTATTTSTWETYKSYYVGSRASGVTRKMSKAEIQERKAVRVLETIHASIDEHAIIAGGAPRNWHLDMEARDVDIYIPLRGFKSLVMIETLLKLLKVNPRKVVAKSASSGKHHQNHGIPPLDIVDVVGFKLDDIEYDVIFYRSTELSGTKKVLDSFDVNICKTYVDMRGRIILTEEAEIDLANKTITCNILSTDVKGMKLFQETRYPKLKATFPDYEFVGMLRNKGEVI